MDNNEEKRKEEERKWLWQKTSSLVICVLHHHGKGGDLKRSLLGLWLYAFPTMLTIVVASEIIFLLKKLGRFCEVAYLLYNYHISTKGGYGTKRIRYSYPNITSAKFQWNFFSNAEGPQKWNNVETSPNFSISGVGYLFRMLFSRESSLSVAYLVHLNNSIEKAVHALNRRIRYPSSWCYWHHRSDNDEKLSWEKDRFPSQMVAHMATDDRSDELKRMSCDLVALDHRAKKGRAGSQASRSERNLFGLNLRPIRCWNVCTIFALGTWEF